MRIGIVVLAVTLAGCSSARPEGAPSGPSRAPRAAFVEASPAGVASRSGRTAIEGTIIVEDDVVQICERFTHSPPSCIDGVVVEDLPTDAIPRLAENAGRLWSWPPVVVEGALRAGVLVDARIPTMYRVDVRGAMVDRSALTGRSINSTTLVAEGQEIGLVPPAGRPRPEASWRLVSDAGDELEVRSPTPCPASASCLAGYFTLRTDGIRPGTYRLVSDRPQVLDDLGIEVVIEDDPASWPPVCCIGDSARSPFAPGHAPPRD